MEEHLLEVRTLAVGPRLTAQATNATCTVCNVQFWLNVLWTECTELRHDEEEVRRHFTFPKLIHGLISICYLKSTLSVLRHTSLRLVAVY